MTFSIGGRHKPNKVLQRALEILLILHADHEQNCSTSAVRAVGSSHVDPFSAISAGIAALYGPLHGGANEAVLLMLDEIGDKKNIPAVHRGGEGGARPADGLRPPGVQVVRPAGQADQEGGRRGVRADRAQPQARDRARARADRAGGRVLHQAEALSQRGLLLGAHLPGDGLSHRVLHGALRAGADARAGWRSGRRCCWTRTRRSPGRGRSSPATTSGRSCRSRSAEVA